MRKCRHGRKNQLLILSLWLLVIVFLTGCLSSQGEEEVNVSMGKLLSFRYNYGDFRYRPFEYTIERETDERDLERISFKAEGYVDGPIDVEEEIGQTILDEIVKFMEEEDVFAWDGFDKSNPEIRDGFSFGLRARFENREIRAQGYMERPEHFRQGHERLADYLLELALSFGDN